MHLPFTKYLRGEGPLWKVFWFYGVIPSNILLAAILIMLKTTNRIALINTLLVVLAVYTVWIVTAVWQCADNVGDARYGILARWLTVVWAINTLLFVVFLGLDISL